MVVCTEWLEECSNFRLNEDLVDDEIAMAIEMLFLSTDQLETDFHNENAR